MTLKNGTISRTYTSTVAQTSRSAIPFSAACARTASPIVASASSRARTCARLASLKRSMRARLRSSARRPRRAKRPGMSEGGKKKWPGQPPGPFPTHQPTNSTALHHRAGRRRELVVVRQCEHVGQRLRQRCELRRRRHLHPFQLDVLIPVHAGAGRDEMPDDDVLLETEEIVLGPADRRIGKD